MFIVVHIIDYSLLLDQLNFSFENRGEGSMTKGAKAPCVLIMLLSFASLWKEIFEKDSNGLTMWSYSGFKYNYISKARHIWPLSWTQSR